MIKSLLRKLFGTSKNQNKIKSDKNTEAKVDAFNLEKGSVIPVFLPDFGDSETSKITKWNFKIGETVKEGDILCQIETKKFTIEFESMIHGRIISVSPKNKTLKAGDEICKISNSNK